MGSLAGINTAHPTWSYMFIRFTNPPSFDYRYIAYAGKGSQITPEIEPLQPLSLQFLAIAALPIPFKLKFKRVWVTLIGVLYAMILTI